MTLFQPLTQAFAQNPYPAYAALRETEGLTYFADYDIHLASRFRDVSDIIMNPLMVRAMEGIAAPEDIRAEQRKMNWHDMPHHERFVQFSLLDSDGAVHDRLRKLVFRMFTPAMIARLRDQIQTYVEGLIDSFADRPQIDFIADMAAHVPGHIIGTLLGVPDEDCPRLRHWSERIVQYFDLDRSAERKEMAETATTEFYHYLRDLAAIRARAPKDDLISQLNTHRDSGALSEDEFISTCMLILMAGHGSTTDVLGSGMHSLLRAPDQMQRLRDDPALFPTAVQEMFRYESPLPFFHRYNAEPVTLHGKTYPKGTKFGVLYGAANRDPAQFTDPDRFDIARSPNRHLAFGGGAHFCLGNHLARLDMEIIFSTLLRRFKSITLADPDPVYKTGLSVRGVKALQLSLIPA